ncbi:copper chaperone PCu(A)C [Catellatospora coxensis]|uniref:copper chaperone PCu(A)C n=1 Tax=Catellatospora coxensis TaxID=310354 RepID=UPI0019434D6E|nr:copper chaperone PCu(A)C [Catellatospora coxensis]
MTRSITMLLAGGATAAALALTGCSAGMNSQTADQVAAVPGFSLTVPGPNGGSVAVRDAMLVYAGPAGYAQGATAPLQLRIFNDTQQPITLDKFESNDAAGVKLATAADLKASPSPAAESPSPAASKSPKASGSPSPEAEASPEPEASPSPATAAPAKLTIPPAGYLELTPASGQFLALTGLKKPVPNGEGVHLKLTFSNGVVIETPERTEVPLAPPLSPEPRLPATAPPTRPGTEGEGH